MKLHTNKEAFNNAILITSNSTNIAPDFIEKDYWLSLVLKRLSESQYVDSVYRGAIPLDMQQKVGRKDKLCSRFFFFFSFFS